MTRKSILTAVATLALAPAAWADGHATGDAAAGERLYRTCAACHVVANDGGEVLAGRGRPNQQAPNLFGLFERQAGSVAEFARYSPSMVAAGEAGLVWTQESFVAYVPNPTEYLRETLDDGGARSGMAPQRVSGDDLVDLWTYIVSLSE